MIKTLFKGAIEGDLTPPELHELKELGVGSKLALALGDNAPEKMYSTLVNYYEVKETECPLCGKPLREGHSGTKMCFYCKTNIAPKMDKEVFIFTPDRELLAIFLENLTGDSYSLPEEETKESESDDKDEDSLPKEAVDAFSKMIQSFTGDTDNDDSDPYYRESCPHDKRDAFEDLEAIVNGFSTDLEYQTFEYYEQAVNHGIGKLGDIVKSLAKEISSLRAELESIKNNHRQSPFPPKASPHDTAKAELLKHLKDLTKLLGE